SSSCGIFRGLQGDAVNRAGRGAQVAGNAPLSHVGIPGQDDPSTPTRGKFRFLLRIKNGVAFMERVKERQPHTSHNADHSLSVLFSIFLIDRKARAQSGNPSFIYKTMPAVIIRLMMVTGSRIFQPKSIS